MKDIIFSQEFGKYFVFCHFCAKTRKFRFLMEDEKRQYGGLRYGTLGIDFSDENYNATATDMINTFVHVLEPSGLHAIKVELDKFRQTINEHIQLTNN